MALVGEQREGWGNSVVLAIVGVAHFVHGPTGQQEQVRDEFGLTFKGFFYPDPDQGYVRIESQSGLDTLMIRDSRHKLMWARSKFQPEKLAQHSIFGKFLLVDCQVCNFMAGL